MADDSTELATAKEWFWTAHFGLCTSVDMILGIKAKCTSICSNYMLNFGPDPLGNMPVAAVDILAELARRQEREGGLGSHGKVR